MRRTARYGIFLMVTCSAALAVAREWYVDAVNGSDVTGDGSNFTRLGAGTMLLVR